MTSAVRDLYPGEAPLVAFVSSVMRPEIEWARRATVEALAANPSLMPWAFEFTPASSDGAINTYLTKVREADVVIWLVGDTTTRPVRDEISEALAVGARLWVVRLPAETRDEMTNELLAEVGARAKYGDAASEAELRELLALTFSDEVVRAIRGKPGFTRVAALEQLARASRARMVARWRAVGVSRPEAIAFADDVTVGTPPDSVLPSADDPLRVIVGEVGVGKSVVAERLLQEAIREARERATARIPIFVRARDVTGSLEELLLARSAEIGSLRTQGAFVVVDGLDELDRQTARRVIEVAREMLESYPEMRIVATSRELPFLTDLPEVVPLQQLSEEAALQLISRIAQRHVTAGWMASWAESVRTAALRPLFAILLGLHLGREETTAPPPPTGVLLAELVTRAIDPAQTPDVLPLLRSLAVRATDTGRPVPASEVHDVAARAAIGRSGLVNDDGKSIEFALTILTQWFAAQSLLAGDVDVADIATEPVRLDRWLYALAIALGTGSRSFIDNAMRVLVDRDPGFASQLVHEGLWKWGSEAVTIPVPPLEVATALRQALLAWARATAPVGEAVLPRYPGGAICALAVTAQPGWLTFGWHRGTPPLSEGAAVFPDGISLLTGDMSEWEPRRGGKWTAEPGWQWRWGLEVLAGDVQSLVKQRALRVNAPHVVDENLWVLALASIGKQGHMWHEPIALESLDDVLRTIPRHGVITLRDRYVHVDQMLDRLAELRTNGTETVSSPWPGPDASDMRGGWIWDVYTPDQQLRRIHAIYEAALDTYDALVGEWFPRLRNRMLTATTLPAGLIGEFSPSPPGTGRATLDSHVPPTMTWHLEALEPGSRSFVSITFAPDERQGRFLRSDEEWRREAERQQERLEELRPRASKWISFIEYGGIADVFQIAPLVGVVYDWLRDDLRRIKWVQ